MKILYIHSRDNDHEFYNDYMNDLLLHGLREIYGNDVIDYPGCWYLYNDEINNREFLIACTDGDEDKVRNLALKFASRVKSIKERVGELDQQRLFLLAGILAEEENQELNDNLSIDEMTGILKGITKKIESNIDK